MTRPPRHLEGKILCLTLCMFSVAKANTYDFNGGNGGPNSYSMYALSYGDNRCL